MENTTNKPKEEKAIPEKTVAENAMAEKAIPEKTVAENAMTEKAIPEKTIAENAKAQPKSVLKGMSIVAIPIVLFLVTMTIFSIKDSFNYKPPDSQEKHPETTEVVVPWAKEISTVIDAIFFAILITAGITDLFWAKVYNWCTFTGIGVGLALSYLLGGLSSQTLPSLESSLLGFGVGLGIFIALYMMGMMGGGDVKLMGAIGALKGYPFVLHAIFYSALMGGLVACFYILIYKILNKKNKDKEKEKEKGEKTIPYGFSIAIGTLLAYFFTSSPSVL